MEEFQYDEFGNYIGAGSDDSDSISFNSHASNESQSSMTPEEKNSSTQLVLRHQYDPGVEVLVQDDNDQPLNEPLIKPEVENKIIVEEDELRPVNYSRSYLSQLSRSLPERIRNISLVGNFHCGKSTLFDYLVYHTHPDLDMKKRHIRSRTNQQTRYTDTHLLEIEKGISIKSSAGTFLVPDLAGKSMICSVIDTPGHLNFIDEVEAGAAVSDTMVLILDAAEGLTDTGKVIINYCVTNDIPLSLVINKLDRLVLELKLPLLDSYLKIVHTLAQVNSFMKSEVQNAKVFSHMSFFSPSNNVAFAAGKFGVFFTLNSIAKQLVDVKFQGAVDYRQLASRLWGPYSYNAKTGKFSGSSSKDSNSFVQLVWTNFYKAMALCAGTFDRVKGGNVEEVCEFFGSIEGFADFIGSLNSPQQLSENQIHQMLQSDLSLNRLKEIPYFHAIATCSNEGSVIARVSKLLNTKTPGQFYGLTKVFSGKLTINKKIKVLGPSYSEENKEDLFDFEIRQLYLPCGKYNVPVNQVSAGSICLIGGTIGSVISKSATLYSGADNSLFRFQDSNTMFKGVFKVSIKPKLPSHLPELLSALQSIDKSYYGVEIKAEETGEYIISGSGELFLDCVLFDIRYLFGNDLEIKVSEPFVSFQESVSEQSLSKVDVYSNNGKNHISIICEPLESDLVKDAKSGTFNSYKQLTDRKLASLLREKYHYDALSSRSVWSIGVENGCANLLLNDTLSDEVDQESLEATKKSIIQGFEWAMKEGPLCDEPISDVKFKIIEISLASSAISRSPGQILPMVRKACYAAFLLARPQILEPVFGVEFFSFKRASKAISSIISRRRGAILREEPVSGTQLVTLYGQLPVLDSVGFETDLRLQTQGQAMGFARFVSWQTVKGDPLDTNAFIPKLKPAHPLVLARDLVVKTRRRKGLTGEISIEKYVDQETFEKFKEAI